MRHGLDLLRRHFQFVVIDGPPVLSVTDASIIATQVDGVVLVVGSKTSSDTAAKARNALRSVSAHVLGALINNAKLDASEQYFYSSDYTSADTVPGLNSGSHPL
jgi:Mrp family chromosome partitioning ATPase